MEQPQHMEALDKAHSFRTQRARIKEAIKRGEQSVPGVLADVPECLQTMQILSLLTATFSFHRRIGVSMIKDAGASPFQQLKDLDPEQRDEIAAMVSDWEECRRKRVAA